jgi:hypothetical protein
VRLLEGGRGELEGEGSSVMSVVIGEKRREANKAGKEGGGDDLRVVGDAGRGDADGKGEGGGEGDGKGEGGGEILGKIVESARRIGGEVVSIAESAVERKRGEAEEDKDRISLSGLHRAEVDLREVMVEQDAQLVCSEEVRERARAAWGALRKMVKDMSRDRCGLGFRV